MSNRNFPGLALLLCCVAAAAVHAEIIPPLTPGAYPVGCSDVAQDFSRVKPGETAQEYWEGIPADNGHERYVTDLLSEPGSTPTMPVTFPDNDEVFGDQAGKTLGLALVICYPTTVDNARASYALPSGASIPHMQRTGQAPLISAARAQWPALLFSHGLGGSPLDSDYVQAMTRLASYGYIVVAPFHADSRIVDIKLEGAEDVARAILNFRQYTAMQSTRPVQLATALDYVLAQPAWSPHIDANHVAGFGASLGGESLLLMAGAKLTVSVGLSSQQVIVDDRLKAIVVYVPYFGQSIFPAFGRDQNGIDFINPIPVLAIAGTADTVAPLSATRKGMDRLVGTHILVTLEGVEHGFDVPSTDDIFTWTLTFLAAETARDPAALAGLQRATGVRGGGDDRLALDYVAPYPATGDEVDVVEFFNDSLGHYFMTADVNEIAILDAGVPIAGWSRTGYVFKAYALGAAAYGAPVCRFFGTPGSGPNTHFFTLDERECGLLKADPVTWTFEGYVFRALAAPNGACPADKMIVTRFYNNGMGGQANHRYTTSAQVAADLRDAGWVEEGPVMCTPP